MAKCLKNLRTGEIKRESETTYEQKLKIQKLVDSGSYSYVPKKDWKVSKIKE